VIPGVRSTGRGTGDGGRRSLRVLLRAATLLRDGWAILGISLLLLVATEVAYRAQAAVRLALFPSRPPAAQPRTGAARESAHPNAGEAWWNGWWQVVTMGGVRRYSPYAGYVWAKSFHSRYVNVDSAGHRVTPQAPPRGPRLQRVVLLGGSTMWGYTVPDSFTIPSLVAARLRARGLDNVQVENLAQPGYNVTQDLIALLLEVRNGAVPTVAVFLDGHNDVAAAWWAGRPGGVLEQQELTSIFERRAPSFRSTLLTALTAHFRFVERLRGARPPASAARQRLGPPPPCLDVASLYRRVTDEADALGREFGFATVFLWQPLLATTHKPLTPWERSIAAPAYLDYLVRCTATADSVMHDRLGRSYIPLHALFDRDTTSVFLDYVGHVTKRGNDAIAERITEIIAPVLKSRS
jgi:hypothetical protein